MCFSGTRTLDPCHAEDGVEMTMVLEGSLFVLCQDNVGRTLFSRIRTSKRAIILARRPVLPHRTFKSQRRKSTLSNFRCSVGTIESNSTIKDGSEISQDRGIRMGNLGISLETSNFSFLRCKQNIRILLPFLPLLFCVGPCVYQGYYTFYSARKQILPVPFGLFRTKNQEQQVYNSS